MKKQFSMILVLGIAALTGCADSAPVGIAPAAQLGVPGGGAAGGLALTITQLPEGCGVLSQSEYTDSSGMALITKQVNCDLPLADAQNADWGNLKDALTHGAGEVKEIKVSGATRTLQYEVTRDRELPQGRLEIRAQETLETDELNRLAHKSESQSLSGAGDLQQIKKVTETISAQYRDPLIGRGRVTLSIKGRYVIARPAGASLYLQQNLATAQFNEAVKRQHELATSKLGGK